VRFSLRFALCVLESGETLHEAKQRIQLSEGDFFPIRMTPAAWSSITQEQLDRSISKGKQEMTLGSLCEERLPYLRPDLPLEMALHYVYRSELIPVVSRADLRKLEGVISRDAVLSKYMTDEAAEADLP
jgi:hypothetical protein